MIFVTVGVQLPFDRLIRAMDHWASDHRNVPIVAQVGRSSYDARFIDTRRIVTPTEFRELLRRADLVVSHAGMGSIITALEAGKPIVVMPRRAELKEHRNDHQLATSRYMASRALVAVAHDETELELILNERSNITSGPTISDRAEPNLLNRISDFILTLDNMGSSDRPSRRRSNRGASGR